MKRIGITGQQGFIGTHLFNNISLLKDQMQLIPFEKAYFDSADKLQQWVQQCDVIVHLAAMNRSDNEQLIYETNTLLVAKLTDALTATGATPHIIFSSSAQEKLENVYGASKREGKKLFKQWAQKSGGKLSSLTIPNVFGPFGKPFYNSVVSTFCYQLCNNMQPAINKDSEVKFIYINELITVFIDVIEGGKSGPDIMVNYTSLCNVSNLLKKLTAFKEAYLDNGIFPSLPDNFSFNLFNTFRSYINLQKHFPVRLKQNSDERGVFIELAKINVAGQVSYSVTHPGITRGNHFHTRKIERFMVIRGKALIELRRFNTNEVLRFEMDGNEPAYVDMPIWYIHNIKNTGADDLYTVFWINEFYDPKDPDTYFETV